MTIRNSEENAALFESMVGRRIVAVQGQDGQDGCGVLIVWLTLDDGSVIEFEGWGHDWWGLYAERVTAAGWPDEPVPSLEAAEATG